MPGQSGNPGGRPRGLAALVREQTNDGKELVDLMLSILRGELVIDGNEPTHRERMAAAEWLADRGFGKPETTNVNLTTETYSIEELATAIARQRIKERMAKPPEVTPGTKDDRH